VITRCQHDTVLLADSLQDVVVSVSKTVSNYYKSNSSFLTKLLRLVAKLLKRVLFSWQSLKNHKKDEGSPKDINETKFEAIETLLFGSNKDPNLPEGFDGIPFDKWILAKEEFPYPVWQFTKFALYHPSDVFKFFAHYKSYMGSGNGGSRKEFFNYCKMAIYHASRQLGDAVVEEVHFAESALIIVSAIRQKNVGQKDKICHFSVPHFSV